MGDFKPRRLEEYAAREVGLALLMLALALVQSALLPRPNGLAFNLLLLLTICHALLAGPASAARWAFYGGLGLDICAGSTLGSHALALLVATLLPALALARLSRRNWLLPLLGAALGATAYYAVLGLITAMLVAPVDPLAYGVVVALPGLFMALIPALPLFLVLRWLEMQRRGEVPVDVY
jgi:cell shape-determining protein MreD